MKSKDKWMKEQVEIAKRVIRGEIHNDAVHLDGDTDIAAIILSTINDPESGVEWQ